MTSARKRGEGGGPKVVCRIFSPSLSHKEKKRGKKKEKEKRRKGGAPLSIGKGRGKKRYN